MGNNKQPRADVRERTTVDGFTRTPANNRSHIYLHDQRSVARRPVPTTRRPVTSSQRRTVAAPAPQQVPQKVRIDMSLPGEVSKPLQHPTFRLKVKSARRKAVKVMALAMVLIVGAWSLLFLQGLFTAQKAFKGGAHAAALEEKVDPSLLKGEGSGRINVLLLGIGGVGHDGPDLTDTIMVASIDPINHKTSLISIPRDLWVQVPGHGSMKINAAFAMGKYDSLGRFDGTSHDTRAIKAGFASTDKQIQKVLGITIHYNALLDFKAFKQAVDAVGGVNVKVPTTLYDPTMAWENGWNSVIAKKGSQVFDGKQALLYVRSRETSSDFARSERQRAVILALKQKIEQLGTLSNPLKLSGLLNSFGDNVTTDLSLSDASRLYDITKQIPENDVTSVGLTDNGNHFVTTGRIGNQSVVRPVAGLYDYSAIKLFIRKTLPDSFIVKEHANVLVVDGGAAAGVAKAKAEELKSYGYNVSGIIDSVPSYAHTVLANTHTGSNPYTQHYLEMRFHVTATTGLSDSSIQQGGHDFILVLGSDEAISQ